MRRFLRACVVLLWVIPAWAGETPPTAAIASAHPLATEAGHEVLAQGGNAFDAAIAVAAALAVVEPWNSGLGGGGFFLLHRARDGHDVMIDARERAPLAATRDMYVRNGRVVPGLSVDGALAAGIPGTPAGLVHLAKNYGRLPLARSLAPAIRLAQDGFAVTPHLSRIVLLQHARLHEQFPATGKIFMPDGFVPSPGDRLRQPELAQTLRRLADRGAAGFYRGDTARRLVQGVRAAGGIWTHEDLKQYRVVERAPVRIDYRGVRITTAALPSSGGVVLGQMLKLLEGFELDALPRARRVHTIVEAMRLAYRDRARHLGDPDFTRINVVALLAPDYIDTLRAEMRLPKTPVAVPAPAAGAGANTTHFSIIDKDGNRVAATLSLNTPFGSGFIPPGTGVVLNNELDDFAAMPGVPNTYGLVGGEANAVAPGKRPLSSMAPTFLERDDVVVILGTPGGSRIITMVLLATLEFAHGRGAPAAWVALPRFHHQYLPDVVFHENNAFDADTQKQLIALGHRLEAAGRRGYGNMQLIWWDRRGGEVRAASDPRGEGAAVVK